MTGIRPARRGVVVVAAAAPALLLALLSVAHPASNTHHAAQQWFVLHIVLLPVFPLVALAPWLVARQVDRRLGRLAAVFGYVYACFYTALDVLAGIGAGALQVAGFSEAKAPVYAIGGALAVAGVIGLVAATLVASVAALRHAGVRAIPGSVLALAGSVYLYWGHVYFGRGTLAVLLIAVGYLLLALVVTRPGWRSPLRTAADS